MSAPLPSGSPDRAEDWAAILRPAKKPRRKKKKNPLLPYPERSAFLPLPAEPTDIMPGEKKVFELAKRVLAGEQLFHPWDEDGSEKYKALRAELKASGRNKRTTLRNGKTKGQWEYLPPEEKAA